MRVNILSMRVPGAALFLLLLLGFCFSCANTKIGAKTDPGTSDEKALRIADEVMRAMGGQSAWDATRYLSWNFFGSRTLLWDKWTGDVRIEWLKKPRKVIVSLVSGQGKVQLNGVEQIQPDSLAKYLQMGKEAWINDSYWLVMPFKLRDPGVTLRYLGAKASDDGRAADLLQLTFSQVGVTPDNKYQVWVDKKTRLVTQWSYFEKFTDEKPQFQLPWTDYQRYGRIMLSSGRGRDGSTLTPIQVTETVPPGSFERF